MISLCHVRYLETCNVLKKHFSGLRINFWVVLMQKEPNFENFKKSRKMRKIAFFAKNRFFTKSLNRCFTMKYGSKSASGVLKNHFPENLDIQTLLGPFLGKSIFWYIWTQKYLKIHFQAQNINFGVFSGKIGRNLKKGISKVFPEKKSFP